MTSDGYIKLYRKMTKWGWYKDNNTKCVFLHLLFMACYEPCFYRNHFLETGQIATTLKEISEGTGISVQSIRTSLNRLKSTNEITINSTNKFSIITLLNYSDYQGDNKPSNNQLTNNQQTTNKQLTNASYNKEIKEIKKNKEVKKVLLLSSPDLPFGGKVESSERIEQKRNVVPQFDVDFHFKRITERYGKESTKEKIRELMETLPNIEAVYKHFGIKEN